MSIGFHTRTLKRRLNRLLNSVTEAIGEKDIEVRKLDDEQISHDFYMVKVQLQRLERYIK